MTEDRQFIFIGFAPTLTFLAAFDPKLPIMKIMGSTTKGGSDSIEDTSEQGRYMHKGVAHMERLSYSWDASTYNGGKPRTPIDILSEVQTAGWEDLPIDSLEVRFTIHSPIPEPTRIHFEKRGISKGFMYRIFTTDGVRLPEQDIIDILDDMKSGLEKTLTGDVGRHIKHYAKPMYLEMLPEKTRPNPAIAKDLVKMVSMWENRKWVKLADRHKEKRSVEDTIVHRVTD
jgi:hypothetical protein